jgi:DNA-binding response OmpR family regulator
MPWLCLLRVAINVIDACQKAIMGPTSATKVLVIDDDVTQRLLVKEYLEAAGCVVRMAGDGRKGLKLAASGWPDVILLDLMLPELDGYTVCTCLKEAPATAKIPIILITGARDRDVISRGLAAGADDFVTKPVDWEFLADRVDHVLRRSAAAAAVVSEPPSPMVEMDLRRELDAAQQRIRELTASKSAPLAGGHGLAVATSAEYQLDDWKAKIEAEARRTTAEFEEAALARILQLQQAATDRTAAIWQFLAMATRQHVGTVGVLAQGATALQTADCKYMGNGQIQTLFRPAWKRLTTGPSFSRR